jgi:hypothetical protein
MSAAPRRQMWWGEERQCQCCKGWWPADGEFYAVIRGYPTGHCKACRAEADSARHKSIRQQSVQSKGA